MAIGAFSIAHISILVMGDLSKSLVKYAQYGAVVVIVSLTTVLISVIGWELDETAFFRLIGILAILDVLGSVSVPILRKITSDTAVRQE